MFLSYFQNYMYRQKEYINTRINHTSVLVLNHTDSGMTSSKQ